MASMRLTEFQNEAVTEAIRSLKEGHKAPVISSAMGTGKSIIIAELCRRILSANVGARIIVGTHIAKLLTQNAEKLRRLLPSADIGIFSDSLGQKDKSRQITFAGIQSIYRHDPGKINLLIIDEAHAVSHHETSMWRKFISMMQQTNPNLKIVGLSGTPFRTDSGPLVQEGSLFDHLCFDYGVGQAIRDGYLVRPVAKTMKTKYDISGVKKLAGEYNLSELEKATNIDALTQSAVKEMLDAGLKEKYSIVFCNGVNHSFAVRDAIRMVGVDAETVTGDTPEDERDRILELLKIGTIRAVTNFGVWTTGVDIPNVNMISMMRHTMSGGLLLQCYGRGSRPIVNVYGCMDRLERKKMIASSAKPHVTFLDFGENIRRLGMLDQISGKKKEHNPQLKDCPECFTICNSSDKVCPDCGYSFEAAEAKEKAEREAKLAANSYVGPLVSDGRKYIEDREVVGMSLHPHNLNKEGKTPCIKIRYDHPDGTRTYEFKSPLSDKARYHFKIWWAKFSDEGYPFHREDLGVILQDNMFRRLRVPSRIVVNTKEKFERIIHYDFTRKEREITEDDIIDIPFD